MNTIGEFALHLRETIHRETLMIAIGYLRRESHNSLTTENTNELIELRS